MSSVDAVKRRVISRLTKHVDTHARAYERDTILLPRAARFCYDAM